MLFDAGKSTYSYKDVWWVGPVIEDKFYFSVTQDPESSVLIDESQMTRKEFIIQWEFV